MIIEKTATAIAHPNIAFIKYWGNKDEIFRIPQNSSISMNLAELYTTTSVHFSESYKADLLWINDSSERGAALTRVSQFLDIVREWSNEKLYAAIGSETNFPSSAGIASSASAFAALALAATKAVGLDLSEKDLSRLARRGSGSASRSIPSGFVEWHAGTDDSNSYSESFAPPIIGL